VPRRAVEGQVLRRIGAICATGADDRALRHEVLEQVSRCVPFDAHAWLMTDPETSVGSSPLADVPFLAELPTLVGLKYRTRVNRWTLLETGRVRTLLEATAGDPSRSPMWRDLLAAHDVVDVASSVFRDRYGCWGFLDLWREAPGLPFAPDEVRFLGQLGPMVTAALRHAQASTFSTRRRAGAVPAGPVVLLLSPRLEVRARTPQADRYLERLVPPREGARAVPAGAYNVAAQLLAVETGVDGNPPRARVHLGGDVWLTLSAARIPHEHQAAEPDITVTLELTSTADRLDLFTRCFALSPRETQLVHQLATGTDTRHTARLLALSESTIQDHLKAVFAKTAVHSRAELLARALGA
jgi:DNA-binding CsgD family transcriptional regulator